MHVILAVLSCWFVLWLIVCCRAPIKGAYQQHPVNGSDCEYKAVLHMWVVWRPEVSTVFLRHSPPNFWNAVSHSTSSLPVELGQGPAHPSHPLVPASPSLELKVQISVLGFYGCFFIYLWNWNVITFFFFLSPPCKPSHLPLSALFQIHGLFVVSNMTAGSWTQVHVGHTSSFLIELSL